MFKYKYIKKYLFIFIFLTIPINIFSQSSYHNGIYGAALNDPGNLQFSLLDSLTREIEQFSLLVAVGPNAVFDYAKDAATVDSNRFVSQPAFSPIEIYGAYDNSASGAAPNILEEINVYGWNNGQYGLIKYTIANQSASPMDVKVGLEIRPKLSRSFALDTLNYLLNDSVFYAHDHNNFVGFKFLSHAVESVTFFDWYNGYNNTDDSLYNWMHTGTFDGEHAGGSDGVVIVAAMETVTIPANNAIEVYIGVGGCSGLHQMLISLEKALNRYRQIIDMVPQIRVTPNSVDFDTVEVGQTATETLTLYNEGSVDLEIDSVYFSDTTFSANLSTPLNIAGGDSALFEVAFTPQTNGDYADEMVIVNNTPFQTNFNVPLTAYVPMPLGIEANSTPKSYQVFQNYPNPFNPSTTLHFQLPKAAIVQLKIFNIAGQHVRTLIDGQMVTGVHKTRWDGKNEIGLPVGSGIYFYRIETADYQSTHKMILMK